MMPCKRPMMAALLAMTLGLTACTTNHLRGTGDLGVVIERASGRIQVVDTSSRTILQPVADLGDLSHASTVYSRDGRYAFIFGRDGGLNKVDILTGTLVKRVMQAGNSIGGAISQSGGLVAVANYQPGGIKVFTADTLTLVADIPAMGADGQLSKVVGLADVPGGERFIFSLYDGGEIWMVDLATPAQPKITKFLRVGNQPYDGLITPDGHYYLAGLFGEDGLAMLDLWRPELGVKRILNGYGRGEEKLPVYKMPHLRGWAMAGKHLFLPAIGRHELLVVSSDTWKEVARIRVHGQPVFAMARPDGRQIWVNFAHPANDVVQVIDVPSMKVIQELRPGKAVMHMEFTPRGEHVWVAERDEDRVEVYRTDTFEKIASLPAEKPSGIFFTSRANRIGL